MPKQLFEINALLKCRVKELEDLGTIEVDDVTLNILNYYKDLVEEQSDALNLAAKHKSREFDAFSIGDAISDGICLVDENGIVMAINKGYTDITEIEEKEIVGKNIKVLIEKGYFTDAVSMLVLEKKKSYSPIHYTY